MWAQRQLPGACVRACMACVLMRVSASGWGPAAPPSACMAVCRLRVVSHSLLQALQRGRGGAGVDAGGEPPCSGLQTYVNICLGCVLQGPRPTCKLYERVLHLLEVWALPPRAPEWALAGEGPAAACSGRRQLAGRGACSGEGQTGGQARVEKTLG